MYLYYRSGELNSRTNVRVSLVENEWLLQRLKEEEEKNKLLAENAKLKEKNVDLMARNEEINIQLKSMEKNVQEKCNVITQLEINKQKEIKETMERILHKVFTPGQIKLLMAHLIKRGFNCRLRI